jgi:hypothetical protein
VRPSAVAIATATVSDYFGSSHSERICNDHVDFWITNGGRQSFMTAERSGSDSNARCKPGYNAMN